MKRLLPVLAAWVGVLLCGGPVALADPPPPEPPGVQIPPVFCFRITDIVAVAGDPEGNKFQFMFETLNWSNREAFDLTLARNDVPPAFATSGGLPFFSGAAVEPEGRPIGPGGDDAQFAAVPNSPGFTNGVGAKVGATNNWVVTSQTSTFIRYASPTTAPGTGQPNRDLLGAASTAAAVALVPGAVLVGNTPVVPNFETVDNGAPGVTGPGASGPDNVLDGFIIEVDDFDPGELISFNWFKSDANGNSIGVSGNGNAFGFGTFTIFRVASDGPALWARVPAAPEGPGANTGTTSNLRDMFVSMAPTGEQFQVEFGSGLTAPFLNPADNIYNAPINAQLIPEPSSLLMVAAGLFGLAGFGIHRARRPRRVPSPPAA